jgi:ergothioneine biosynthesis protein EgtB
MQEVRAYRANVDARIARLLAEQADNEDLAALIELGLQHEQQHQELILTDVKHLLAQSALYPAYAPASAPAPAEAVAPLSWAEFSGGLVEIGHDGDGFCFDNELPRHREYLPPFALAERLVTNGEYLEFVEAGGYRDPALWLSEGWDQVGALALAHPIYWQRDDAGTWSEFTLHGLRPLDLARPVSSVSLYEADAYAHWRGVRLPTEAEWELAARRAEALHQMFGHGWQWTSSSYAPYPGFFTPPGALGEYNGKFMLNQYVLRGSSGATPPGHSRASYRNFFPAGARWQFTGIRLAR